MSRSMKEFFRSEVIRDVAGYLEGLPLSSLIDEHGSPLLLLDPAKMRTQYRALQAALPMVQHHYAIKALRHPAAVAAVNDCDGYFDVMTNGDVDIVRAYEISPERCVHTNPIKKPRDIAYALAAGITTFVVDNPAEVDKFVEYADDVELLLRLSFRNPGAKSDLSFKFGVAPYEAVGLTHYALTKKMRVAGFSLHVGSQIDTAQAYVEAITQATKLIDEVESTYSIQLKLLDIGGGFPVNYLESMPGLDEITSMVSPLLE